MGFFEKIGRKLDPEHYNMHDKQEKERQERKNLANKINLARAQGKFEEAEELRKQLYGKTKDRKSKKVIVRKNKIKRKTKKKEINKKKER